MKSITMNIHPFNTLRFFNVNDLAVSRYFLERDYFEKHARARMCTRL
jgi:hypothetical protein